MLNAVPYADMLKPRPKPVYLVDKLITERTINIIYGYPGSKKSLFIADLVMAIATGEPFLPAMPGSSNNFTGYATKKAPVLWMDYENGEDLSYERFTAFGKVYNATAQTNLFYSCLPSLPVVDNKHIGLLIQEIRKLPVIPEVLVIDTLLRFAKVRDENSSEMDRIMAMARKLVDDLNVTIFLISHSNKTIGSRAGNALRGHSSIEGGADAVFRANSDKDTDIIDIINEKARRNPIEPISARFTFTNTPGTDQLETARIYYEPYQSRASQASQKAKANIDRINNEILTLLEKNGPTSKNQIALNISGRRTTIMKALTTLESIMAISVSNIGNTLMCEITNIGRGLLCP